MLTDNGENLQELQELAKAFFRSMDFVIKKEVDVIGSSGKVHHFEMLLKANSDLEINELLVKIVDWKRTVGVDRLIRFERILNDLTDRKGMIVSNLFSDSAVKFAKRRGLIIYAREHLEIQEE
ncbi:MAG: restriction endonuclease [Candidatus Heimdallarchaeota archaeon]|nr:restriction endonuclease [Candidatus Heimdallarchaeota archaeon]MBY8993554.1 restriction endonuclease [Candidatus Heimdallarchaeota archaeon]